MKILALDSALDALGAAFVDDGIARARMQERMSRGQAERIAPLVQDIMQQAGARFSEIDRIAVTVGPGSFTGVRVGLAFARGLAVSLDRPCVGLSTLEALALENGADGWRAALIATAGICYVALYRDGAAVMAPQRMDEDEVGAQFAALMNGGGFLLRGPDLEKWAELPGARCEIAAAPDPVALARLAAARDPARARPDPLYLRAALA